jgi:hypothetical protein
MPTFVAQGMVADKLTKTGFTQIILLAVGFFPVFLYICTLARRAMEYYFDNHNPKITLYFLIAKFLY